MQQLKNSRDMPIKDTEPTWEDVTPITDSEPQWEDVTPIDEVKKKEPSVSESSDGKYRAVSTPERELLETGEVVKEGRPRENKEKASILAGIKSPQERTIVSKAIDLTDEGYEGVMTPYQKMVEFSNQVKDLNKNVDPKAIASMDKIALDKFQADYKKKAHDIAVNLGLQVDEAGNVKPYEEESKRYSDKLNFNVELLSQKKPEEEKGFLSNLMTSIASGTQKASGAALDLLGFATGLNYFDSYRDLAKGNRYNAEALAQQANKYDQFIEDYLKQGDLTKAAGAAVTGAAESLPYMIPAMVNPEYGAYVMGSMAGIDQYRNLETKDIPEWAKVANSLQTAAWEAIFENVGTASILSRSKQAMLELGEKQGKQAIVNAVNKTFENTTSKLGRTPSWVKEGWTEVFTGIGEDITDKVTYNPDAKIGSHAVDDFTVGAVMGKLFAMPQDIAKFTDRKAVRDYSQKIIESLPVDMDIPTKVELGWKIAERNKLQDAEDRLDEKFKGKYTDKINSINSDIDNVISKWKETQKEGVSDGATEGVKPEVATDQVKAQPEVKVEQSITETKVEEPKAVEGASYNNYGLETPNAKIENKKGTGDPNSFKISDNNGNSVIGLMRGASFGMKPASNERGQIFNIDIKEKRKGTGTSLMLDALRNMKKNGTNLVNFVVPSEEGLPFNKRLEEKGYIKKIREDVVGGKVLGVEYEITDKVLIQQQETGVKVQEPLISTEDESKTRKRSEIQVSNEKVAETGGKQPEGGSSINRTEETRQGQVPTVSSEGQKEVVGQPMAEPISVEQLKVEQDGKEKRQGQQRLQISPEDESKVVKTTGIKPKNLRDVYKAGREVFGLNKVQSLAQAIIVDRVVSKAAKNSGKTKQHIYSEIEFRKEDDLLRSKVNAYFQSAWHGSPYQFDKFTTEKIGTGEGAQAFGWGLYFTDLKSIAEGYADKLSSPEILIDGKDFDSVLIENKIPERDWLINIITGAENKEEATSKIDKIISIKERKFNEINKRISGVFTSRTTKDIISRDSDVIKEEISILKSVRDIISKSNKFSYTPATRSLYKVELHKGKTTEQYSWLVWDKNVDNNIVNKIIKSLNAIGKTSATEIGSQSWADLGIVGGIDGNSLYEKLSNILNGDKQASLFLLENGIDGIKYPAESIARGATSDTARGFNYVVFDENAVTIEEVIKFQKQLQGKRGAMLVNDGKSLIYALTDPNVSTPLHEIAHVYERYMLPSEKAAVLSWTGHKTWSVETSEMFARGFEKYLAYGIAPNEKLKSVFEKFKAWLADIYNGIKGSEIDLTLNEDMKRVYDSILTGKKYTPSTKKVSPQTSEQTKKVDKKETETMPKAEIKSYDDVDSLLFQEIKFQGEDRTEKHTTALNRLIDHAIEENSDDVPAFVRAYLASKGNPINEQLINDVLKQRGYAQRNTRGKMYEGRTETGKEQGVGDSNLSGIDQAKLSNRKEAERKINEQAKQATQETYKEKLSRLIARLQLDKTDLPTDIKVSIKDRGIGHYLVLSDKQAKTIADEFTKTATTDELIDVILNSNIHQSIKGNLLINVHQSLSNEYNKAVKEGRNEDAIALADKQIDLYDDFNNQKREQAQGLRFLGTKAFMEVIAPYHYQRIYERGISDTRNRQMTNPTHVASAKRASKAAKRVFNEAVDKTIQQSEKDIQKATEKPQVKPDRLKVLKEREKAAIEKLKKSFKVATSGGITSEGIEAIGELAAVYLEEAAYVVGKAAKRLVGTLKKMGYELSEQEALKYFPKEVDGVKIEDKLAEEETQKAAERLAKNILNLVETEKPETADAIKKMVAELTRKVKETLPEQDQAKKERDVFAIIRNAINDKERRQNVWNTAKEEAIAKIEESNKDDVEKEAMINTIEQAYEEATEFMFAMAEVKEAIRTTIKNKGLSIPTLSKSNIADIKNRIEEIADEVISKINVTDDTTNLKKAIKKNIAKDVMAKIKSNKESAARREAEKERRRLEKEGQKKTDVEIISERLGLRMAKESTSAETKETDKLQEAVNTLMAKYRERDQQRPKRELKTDIQKIAEAIRNKDAYADAWADANVSAINAILENKKLTEAQKQSAIDRINDAYKRATTFTFTEAQVDRAIKRKMKDLDVRIRDVVKEFYDIRSAERGRLVDALIDEAGLDESQSKVLAEAIEKRFDTLVSEGKQKIIDKYVGKINEAQNPAKKAEVKMRKDATAELLELISVGAFDSKAFNEAYATAVGIPQITPEHVAEIKKRASEIQRQKEPLMRHKKTQDLLAYMKFIKGIGFLDLINSIWYANVLGNIKTQERNLIGGFSGVSARIIADSLTTGKVLTPIKGYLRGLEYGWPRFKDVMKEGYAPFSDKIETPGTLEILDIEVWKSPFTKKLIQLARFWGRLMSGLDLLNATAGKESYAQILASEAVNLDRWKTTFSKEYRADIERKIDETLKTDKATVDRFKREIEEDAAEFGYTEIDKKLILLDKIDRARDINITEQASRFGVYSTGNVPTYGTLGAMSDLLATIFKFPKIWWTTKSGKEYAIRPFALLAAFTKIAGNVGEMSLNFVPGVGAVRVAVGGYGIFFSGGNGDSRFSKYHLELTPREKQTIIGMQIIGALSMAILFELSDPGDDDDPFIRITANGTGDYKKNRSLQDWKEYSIGIKMPNGSRFWIPYKYTPLILPFGLIGNIRDSKRFKKEYADTSELELLVQGMLNLPVAMADMTAIANMSEVINKVALGIGGRDWSALPRNVERTITGYYTPGVYRDAVDMVEGLWHVGVEEPIKGVPEYDVNLLKQRFFGRNPVNVIRRVTADGNEKTEYVDVYGRTVERKMPWNEVLSVEAEKTARDKMILNHQKIMGNPSEPTLKSTFFINYNPDGTTTHMFLWQGDKRQNILWHNFLKRRGEYITESILNNSGLEPDQYKEVMKSAIEKATERAKQDIELELMDNPILKIRKEQIQKKE